jgi:hypothetical protein
MEIEPSFSGTSTPKVAFTGCGVGVGQLCLTSLSTIFQLYRGCYWLCKINQIDNLL